MKRYIYILLFIFIATSTIGQSDDENYNKALDKLSMMLNSSIKLDFKGAVFIVENAYSNNQLDSIYFDHQITQLVNLCQAYIKSNKLIYEGKDKAEVNKYASLFKVMTDTIPIQLDTHITVNHYPYIYDFNDIWGVNDWSNMFVTKLLRSKKGNCHSLPYLYKILAEQLGAKAYLSVSPNHLYIKHKSQEHGWYNTELTSGMFPIDSWLMASGYIHLDAMFNKLYMEALDDEQSIVLCVIDLAKGYQRKLGSSAKKEFIIQCCDTALKYYPHYINAIILRAETVKKQFEEIMEEHQATYASEILHLPKAKKLFNEMTEQYARIHQLGYRKMPEKMYLDWLISLKEERNKYENKTIKH